MLPQAMFTQSNQLFSALQNSLEELNYKSFQNLSNSTLSGHARNLAHVLTPIINQINCQLIPSSVIEKRIQTFMTDLRRNNHNPQVSTQKTIEGCYNQFCSVLSPILKKFPSRGWLGRQFIHFCSDCYESYKNNHFCLYCEQIYKQTDHNEADDKEWIECELCQRWNHIDCEAVHANPAIYKEREQQYHCHQCKNPNHSNKNKKQKKEIYKRSQFSSIQDTYTNTLKDDPFVYDAQFSRKVNRKPIEPIELEYVPKKSVTKLVTKVEQRVGTKAVLSVSRDCKLQFNIKIALTEEEIKQDLQQMMEQVTVLKIQTKIEEIQPVIKEVQQEILSIKTTPMNVVKTRASIRDQLSQSRTDSHSHNISPSNIDTILLQKAPKKLHTKIKKLDPVLKKDQPLICVSSRLRNRGSNLNK